MPQMRSIHTHSLTILQTPDILPNHLVISETRPSVRFGLLDEFLPGPMFGCDEEGFSGVAVVECHGCVFFLGGFDGCGLEEGGGLEVSAVFGVVAVEIAYVVGFGSVHVP